VNNINSLTQKTGHFAWCALVALKLARQDWLVLSEAQQNLFLCRWLATALKQRRFHRDVNPDIEWLLKQGRQYGIRAKLTSKLDYLWKSCTGEIPEQNDLFRLTYALETVKGMQWQYRMLSECEWSGRNVVKFNVGVNAIGMLKSSLDVGFDDAGKQVQPVFIKLSGAVTGFLAVLQRCGWGARVVDNNGINEMYKLTAIHSNDEYNKENKLTG
jgi:hypothetical protein